MSLSPRGLRARVAWPGERPALRRCPRRRRARCGVRRPARSVRRQARRRCAGSLRRPYGLPSAGGRQCSPARRVGSRGVPDAQRARWRSRPSRGRGRSRGRLDLRSGRAAVRLQRDRDRQHDGLAPWEQRGGVTDRLRRCLGTVEAQQQWAAHAGWPLVEGGVMRTPNPQRARPIMANALAATAMAIIRASGAVSSKKWRVAGIMSVAT